MKKEKKQRRGETPKPYRGHQSYVNYLGRFVGVFEDVINKQRTSEREFKKLFPSSYRLFKSEIKNHVGHSTSGTLDEVLKREMVSLAYNGSNCLIYELCRHIRNSYCHLLWEIDEDEDKLRVIDKSRGKTTSKGSLSKKALVDFVKTIVNEYENLFKKK